MDNFLKQIVESIIAWQASLVIRKHAPQIVAVTGNIGKTSAKDAIVTVLSRFSYVRKSGTITANGIGIPLAIIGAADPGRDIFLWLSVLWRGLSVALFHTNYPDYLILEIGADRPREIAKIAKWLSPDVVVLTGFAKVPVHIEFFPNRDAIVREKQYLVDALKHDGTLVVNADDDDCLAIRAASPNAAVVYGTTNLADIRASEASIVSEDGKPSGMTFKISQGNNVVPVLIRGSVGIHSVYASLAALAVALAEKVNLVDAAQALAEYETPPGRMKLVPGKNGAIIVDDSYNSSPAAAASALSTLSDMKTKGRKIAILGDMLELGAHSLEEHTEIGKKAAASADILVTVGIRARKIAEGALDAGMADDRIFEFDDSFETADRIGEILKNNDIILVKGSRAMRMERIVKTIALESADET
ncbi:MAG: hypothetical protein KGH93_02320 [Patescibacteria group bacterium]|nr:hypothetical protein [Patescibacteria group bacterium]MDE1946012.1 hypothetical protein [Patescibacteria group bacterium]